MAPLRELLTEQTGLFRYTSTGINSGGMVIGGDADIDAIKRFDNSYSVTTRGFGALQVIGGGAAVFTGGSLVAGGAATCWFGGSGCVAAGGGLLIGGWGGDQFQAGIRAAWTGEPTSTLGGQLLQQTGLSPGAAELLYGLAGIGGAWALPGAVGPRAILFSSDDLRGVEPATQALIDAVARRRVVVIAQPGSDEMRMLNFFNAEASVNATIDGIPYGSILLRPDPSKAALLEEFLHGTQYQLGIVDRLGTSGLGSAETHVKDFMIRHQRLLGLSNSDVEVLRILRGKGL